jgi:hypothetical protein
VKQQGGGGGGGVTSLTQALTLTQVCGNGNLVVSCNNILTLKNLKKAFLIIISSFIDRIFEGPPLIRYRKIKSS